MDMDLYGRRGLIYMIIYRRWGFVYMGMYERWGFMYMYKDKKTGLMYMDMLYIGGGTWHIWAFMSGRSSLHEHS